MKQDSKRPTKPRIPCQPDGPLLAPRDLANYLGVSVRTVWRLLAAGELPEPFYVGARPRWSPNAIIAWQEAKKLETRTREVRQAG
jgi:excisionase family DNA binding protein